MNKNFIKVCLVLVGFLSSTLCYELTAKSLKFILDSDGNFLSLEGAVSAPMPSTAEYLDFNNQTN